MRLTLSSWPCRQRRACVIQIRADQALDHRVFSPDDEALRCDIAEAIRDSLPQPSHPPTSAA